MLEKKYERANTQNAGAALERQAWMAKGYRMQRDPVTMYLSSREILDRWINFGLNRTKRDNAAPGGLGRKTTKPGHGERPPVSKRK